MEEKINIAEILKDKPNGIRLYSPIFGECAFSFVREQTDDICVKKHNGAIESFNSEGLCFALGEVMLFPSKEMRDWSKFFNNGDVLVCYEGKKTYYTIFDCFESNTYKDFKGKFSYDSYKDKWYQNECNLSTNTFHKLSLADSEIYIKKIEERFGGKLNLETLEIEKQPEFKDGDILYAEKDESHTDAIFILETVKGKIGHYACLILHPYMVCKYSCGGIGNKILRYATEEEKLQLFDALAKEGKAWDSDKKAIVDLKPKVELKPFDKVLVRDFESQAWQVRLFSYKDSDSYYCCNGCAWNQCIPYIGNESLLGTTKDVEG